MTALSGPPWIYREVLTHIRQHHPRCPGGAAHQIILRVLSRSRWRTKPLGEAVGVEMQNYIRHHLTSYDQLFELPGIDKAEARRRIKAKVRKKLAKWDRPKRIAGISGADELAITAQNHAGANCRNDRGLSPDAE